MNDEMQKELMAFMEGELSGLRSKRLISRLQSERRLRDAWERQHSVAHLMQMPTPRVAPPGFADRLAQAIALEPSILAPQAHMHGRPSATRWIKVGSMAAVVLVSVTLVGLLPRNPGTPQSTSLETVHALQASASPRGQAQPKSFALRQVDVVAEPGATMDGLIQRDIQRLWVPGYGAYMGSVSPVHHWRSRQAGALSATYSVTEGISNEAVAFSPGNP
ncbi:MAG: sigma-E factor negative regulatory protein [Acidithiobacillus sp.]